MRSKSSALRSGVGRFLFALSFGLVISAIAYVAIRVLDVVLFPEPNPAIVIWSDRSRFAWRVLIAAYLGGAGVFAGYGLSSRAPDRCGRWLERVVIVASIGLLLQTLFAP